MSDTDESQSRVPEGRIRRSTIERFNDELSLLDRPLEGEAEFYDDPPRRSPCRRVGMAAGAAAVLGGIGVFALARVSSTTSDGGDRPALAIALPAPASAPAGMRLASPEAVARPTEAAPPTVAEATVPSAAEATEPSVAAAAASSVAEATAPTEGDPERDLAPAADAEPSRLQQPSRRAWANLHSAAPASKQASATPHKSRRHGRHR